MNVIHRVCVRRASQAAIFLWVAGAHAEELFPRPDILHENARCQAAFIELSRRAEDGEAAAMGKLAAIYHYGIGTQRNKTLAKQWITEGIAKDDLYSSAMAWSILRQREPTLHAAERGSPTAMIRIGAYLFLDPIFFFHRPEQWLVKAYRLHRSPLAARMMADANEIGPLKGGYKEVTRWSRLFEFLDQAQFRKPLEGDAAYFVRIQRAAETGEANALAQLGHFYYTGRGTPADTQRALKYYEQAARRGHLKAMEWLGILFQYDEDIYDLERARYWYSEAAQKGSASAYFGLGSMEEYGSRNDTGRVTRAGHYYRLAILHGYALNRHRLHGFLDKNKTDPKGSFADYSDWGGKGNARAMYYLAFTYLNGIGTASDPEKGLQWLRRAAEMGERWAMRDLGLLYVGRQIAEGKHVMDRLGNGFQQIGKPDYTLALKWLEKASAAGDYDAAIALREMYLNGWGVKQDPVRIMAYGLLAGTLLRQVDRYFSGYPVLGMVDPVFDIHRESSNDFHMASRYPKEIIVPAVNLFQEMIKGLSLKERLNNEFCDVS